MWSGHIQNMWRICGNIIFGAFLACLLCYRFCFQKYLCGHVCCGWVWLCHLWQFSEHEQRQPSTSHFVRWKCCCWFCLVLLCYYFINLNYRSFSNEPACCNWAACTNKSAAKGSFSFTLLTIAVLRVWRPMWLIKNVLRPVRGVGVVNDVFSLLNREERGTMRSKSLAWGIKLRDGLDVADGWIFLTHGTKNPLSFRQNLKIATENKLIIKDTIRTMNYYYFSWTKEYDIFWFCSQDII